MESEKELEALSMEELNHFLQENEKLIMKHEQDIKLLKRKIRQFGMDLLPSQDIHIIERADGSSTLDEVRLSLANEIAEHESRLSETAGLTEIVIETVKREVLEMDENICKKRFFLELTILDRKVKLVYDLEETLASSEKESGPNKVIWFEITFEQDINAAIGEEIIKAADDVAIHSVFSLLKSYLQWVKTKEELITHFTDTYPDTVKVEDNKDGLTRLKIANPKPMHPVFKIEWGRSISGYRVKPDLTMKVEADKELIAMDTKKVLETAPDMFSTMISALGLKPALHHVVNLVATDGREGHLEQTRDSPGIDATV